MIVRIITLFAALGLLAACETAPSTSGDAAGTGASSSTSSSSSASADTGGSSSESEQLTITEELIQIGDRVLFGYDSYELTSDAKNILNNQASFLASNPTVRITIEGHCDERGTREYNLALGESRASATRDYLVAQGVNPARIKIISYGKERPAVIGSNEDAWRFNRRAVSVIN
jgi:peptidoglycan-associated lipoprotein